MYGLIHVALNEMVVKKFGDESWQKILQTADVPDGSFMRMKSYDDSVTMALVGATSKVLGAPVNDCLEAFGEFWLSEFAPESYESLLSAAGEDLFTFLENLDLLHDRISTTFVGYVPPSFGVERISDTEARLNYSSARQGLLPFVVGLLKGMQTRFNIRIDIEHMEKLPATEGEKSLLHLKILPQ